MCMILLIVFQIDKCDTQWFLSIISLDVFHGGTDQFPRLSRTPSSGRSSWKVWNFYTRASSAAYQHSSPIPLLMVWQPLVCPKPRVL